LEWTQLEITYNNELKQLHSTHLTQGPKQHFCFWKKDRPGFLQVFHILLPGWSLYQALVMASECDISLLLQPLLNNTRIMYGGMVLLEMDYSTGIKHSYKQHYYTF
jgi:hypothetical protein